jgi:hypothetical protein
MTDIDQPSSRFEPRIYGVGAWTPHLHFGYDLVAVLRPALLVELGVDRGESYFAFCQSAAENETGTRCFGVDIWQGDKHAGGYDETTFTQVSGHNAAHYKSFSTLLRSNFDVALSRFEPDSIDVLHLDGLHTEAAVRRDVESWLPKLRPNGILLLHDVGVRGKDFGVWKIWEELQTRGRSHTFQDGPGLGVWQKPPGDKLPDFLETLVTAPNESHEALTQYYTERATAMEAKIAQQWRDGSIRHTPFAQQTIIQVFFSKDGGHSEENSVYARVGHNDWKDVRIQLPPGAGAAPLRIDFVSALTIIEIESIGVAGKPVSLDSITVRGDAERLPDPKLLRFQITGVDPQLYLPAIETPGNETGLSVELRLRVRAPS